MKLHVTPSNVSGKVAVPGSKSHTIRAIVAALLADGVSTITAPLHSADTHSALNAAECLGAKVTRESNYWQVEGTGGKLVNPNQTLDLGNSGTGLRLLTAAAATADFQVSFDGDDSLRTRPMTPLLDSLEGLKVKVSGEKCPFSIQGPLSGGATSISAVSSQFLTALLFAAPTASSDTTITVTLLNEAPYVDITLQWLDRCKIQYRAAEDLMYFEVPGQQTFQPFECVIPADFSTACFPLIAGSIACNDKIEIANLDFNDVQGDKAVFEMLKKMGANYQLSDNLATVYPVKLHGADLDLNATPDALPILAVAATLASGTTRLLNTPQARLKETDRIACMTKELRKMGAEIEELADGMIIKGGKLHGAELESYADHRIAMALAIAAMQADSPSVINEAESIAVTYPDFIKDFQRMGADFKIEE